MSSPSTSELISTILQNISAPNSSVHARLEDLATELVAREDFVDCFLQQIQSTPSAAGQYRALVCLKSLVEAEKVASIDNLEKLQQLVWQCLSQAEPLIKKAGLLLFIQILRDDRLDSGESIKSLARGLESAKNETEALDFLKGFLYFLEEYLDRLLSFQNRGLESLPEFKSTATKCIDLLVRGAPMGEGTVEVLFKILSNLLFLPVDYVQSRVVEVLQCLKHYKQTPEIFHLSLSCLLTLVKSSRKSVEANFESALEILGLAFASPDTRSKKLGLVFLWEFLADCQDNIPPSVEGVLPSLFDRLTEMAQLTKDDFDSLMNEWKREELFAIGDQGGIEPETNLENNDEDGRVYNQIADDFSLRQLVVRALEELFRAMPSRFAPSIAERIAALLRSSDEQLEIGCLFVNLLAKHQDVGGLRIPEKALQKNAFLKYSVLCSRLSQPDDTEALDEVFDGLLEPLPTCSLVFLALKQFFADPEMVGKHSGVIYKKLGFICSRVSNPNSQESSELLSNLCNFVSSFEQSFSSVQGPLQNHSYHNNEFQAFFEVFAEKISQINLLSGTILSSLASMISNHPSGYKNARVVVSSALQRPLEPSATNSLVSLINICSPEMKPTMLSNLIPRFGSDPMIDEAIYSLITKVENFDFDETFSTKVLLCFVNELSPSISTAQVAAANVIAEQGKAPVEARMKVSEACVAFWKTNPKIGRLFALEMTSLTLNHLPLDTHELSMKSFPLLIKPLSISLLVSSAKGKVPKVTKIVEKLFQFCVNNCEIETTQPVNFSFAIELFVTYFALSPDVMAKLVHLFRQIEARNPSFLNSTLRHNSHQVILKVKQLMKS